MNDDILRLFPHASADLLARNSGPVAKLESDAKPEPLATQKVQGHSRQRFLVRVESIRARLLDEDNLCEKYHVDLLRYAGVIDGDEASQTKIEVSQRKARKGEAEHTLIEVYSITQ